MDKGRLFCASCSNGSHRHTGVYSVVGRMLICFKSLRCDVGTHRSGFLLSRKKYFRHLSLLLSKTRSSPRYADGLHRILCKMLAPTEPAAEASIKQHPIPSGAGDVTGRRSHFPQRSIAPEGTRKGEAVPQTRQRRNQRHHRQCRSRDLIGTLHPLWVGGAMCPGVAAVAMVRESRGARTVMPTGIFVVVVGKEERLILSLLAGYNQRRCIRPLPPGRL